MEQINFNALMTSIFTRRLSASRALAALLIAPALQAAPVAYTFEGDLISNLFIGIPDFPANFSNPVTTFSLHVAWDTDTPSNGAPTATQSQYTLDEFTVTLTSPTDSFTTTANLAYLNIFVSGNNQQIQFTTADITPTTIGSITPVALLDYSFNLTLADSTNAFGGGLSGLGIPSTLSLADWKLTTSDSGTNFKIYHTNTSGTNKTLGRINTLSTVPEPASAAGLAGLIAFAGAFVQRRRRA